MGTLWNLVSPWLGRIWSGFWYFVGIGIPVFFAFVTAIWIPWDGVRDMRLFFQRLQAQRVDTLDNNMVIGHHNLGDEQSDRRPDPETKIR